MPRKIKLVIFDLDGTLVNAYPAIVESFNFAMRCLCLPLQKSTVIHRAVGWGDKNLLKPFVPRSLLNKALACYRHNHQISLRRKTKFLSGAKHFLDHLKKQGYLLAVASNRPKKFSYIILEHLRIKEYFDYVLCGDEIKKAKPHPDMIFRILKKFSLASSDAVYVGDMTVDVLAGRRAKVKTIAVTTGSSTRGELVDLKPFAIRSRLDGVYRVLRNLR